MLTLGTCNKHTQWIPVGHHDVPVPPRLEITNLCTFWNFSCSVSREKPLVGVGVAGPEVGWLIVVGRVIVEEQFEVSIPTF
jgi:hypothetical protein